MRRNLVYFNGRIIPKSRVRISPDDRGWLFGDGVYESLRVYEGHLFEPEAHFERLARSLAGLRIASPDLEELRQAIMDLLALNGLDHGDAFVYLQITRGVAPRQHAFPRADVPPTVYATVSRFTPAPEDRANGIRVILTEDIRWAHCDLKTVNLLGNVLANQKAKEAGVHEAILVRDGVITEASHSSVAFVRDGVVLTYPLDVHILPGVTRQVVLKLCAELAIPVREELVTMEALRRVDEAMLLSTGAEVTPIVQVDDWLVGNGKPGPVTRRLQEAYTERIRKTVSSKQ